MVLENLFGVGLYKYLVALLVIVFRGFLLLVAMIGYCRYMVLMGIISKCLFLGVYNK